MGYDKVDKAADEFQQRLNQNLLNEQSEVETISNSPLTNTENEEFTQELSGEAQTQGFTENDSELLTDGLSGAGKSITDSAVFSKSDEKGNKQSVILYGSQDEGYLELTQDSLNFYKSKYPNIAKAYLSAGIVTLLDKYNNVIKDANGNPVTVNFNEAQKSSDLNLVSFYLAHNNGQFDINTFTRLKTLQERINSTPETNADYAQLMSEIEQEKLDMMSEKERKHYITAKMWSAYNSGDTSKWIQALGDFYDYECKQIDKKLGIQDSKDYIKEHTHLNDLVKYIDKVVDNQKDNLTKAELMWEIVKGVGDAIDSFIGTQGLTMISALGGATKIASSVPKFGPILAGAIQAYFGVEGSVLIGSGVVDASQAETKEQARNAGAELGLGGIMAKGAKKSILSTFKGLELKEFRSQIRELVSLDDLNAVREYIEKTSFSKAEKQTLLNECDKQQGQIQADNELMHQGLERIYEKDNSISTTFSEQKTRSQLAFRLFKLCKNPVQRSMVNIILNNKKLYLAKGANINKEIFSEIVEECHTPKDVELRKQLIERISNDNRFLTEDGYFNEDILLCIRNCYPETFDSQMKLLDEYINSDSKLDGRIFSQMLYQTLGRSDAEVNKLIEFIHDKNIDIDYINDLFKTNSSIGIDIAKICFSSQDGMISGVPISTILSVPELLKLVKININKNNKKLIQVRDAVIQKIIRNNSISKDEKSLYAILVKDCISNLSWHEPADNITDLCSKILLDEKLGTNPEILQFLKDELYQYCPFHNENVHEHIIDILNMAHDRKCSYKEIYKAYATLMNELFAGYGDKFEYKHKGLLSKYAENGFEPLKSEDFSEEVAYSVIDKSKDILSSFAQGRQYTEEDLHAIFQKTNEPYKKDILLDICNRKEYSTKNILSIASSLTKNNIEVAKKILGKSNLTPSEKADIISSISSDGAAIPLLDVIVENKDIDLRNLPKIMQAIKILDANDAGGNNGHIDYKKVDKYIRLLQNPKLSAWAVQMINDGWDIETISRLAVTKQGLNTANNKNVVIDENTKFFMDFGLNEKEASSIVQAISQNGTLNVEMQHTAIDLINSGIPRHRIGQILSSATISGEYNPRIPADAKNLNGIGLNAFVERYLPVLNNLSPEDIAVKFNAKTRVKLKNMIQNISGETKPALRAKGFDIEGILKKLDAKIIQKTEKGQRAKILSGYRTKNSITGYERILIDRYNPPESIWRSSEETKQWAERKYEELKNGNYDSVRDNEQTKSKDVNKDRTEILDQWYKFMETDEDLKFNPYARVILTQFITKDLLPENSELPPKLNKTLAKKVLADVLNGESLEKNYRAGMNSLAKQTTKSMQMEKGGRKMTWYTVPQTDSSRPDFNANVAKVRALSDGTNWCIRTWNAEPYVQQGNIHFLVDETGMTQVCIRENAKNRIAEIQKRSQDKTIPVAYIDYIQDFIQAKKLSGCEDGIKDALRKKSAYETVKDKLHTLEKDKDYIAILELMGVKVKVLEDGSWEISHYTPYIDGVALNDYGIKENELLSNVSVISGDADFKDSNVTSLPKLKRVDGEMNFGGSNISDLNNLEEINRKKINWF